MKVLPSKRLIALAFILAVVVASVNASYFLWTELQNNNQGEYWDPMTQEIDLQYCGAMFLVVFLPTLLVVVMAESLFGLLWALVRRAAASRTK